MVRRRQGSEISPFFVWCICIVAVILLLVLVVGLIFAAQLGIEHTLTIEKDLLSKITSDTPISGFYGPGSWWAWLITLGMNHGHTIVALWKTGKLAQEWDYDLIGASCYTAAAAIDLMLKSRAIARLGDTASTSVLLPALVCAERVVSVGTGSSLFAMITALLGRSSGRRTAGIAAITLIFALASSGFALRAHQAIEHTAPVFWCGLHGGSRSINRSSKEGYIPFTLVDFPAALVEGVSYLPRLYLDPEYWLMGGVMIGAATAVVFVGSLIQRRNLTRALSAAALTAFIPGALFSTLPILAILPLTAMSALRWLFYWVALWWPIYILAFFPWMGYFPLTEISILEMDQSAALLGIAAAAAIRTLRSIFKATHLSIDSQGLEPVLPVSTGGGTSSDPRNAITYTCRKVSLGFPWSATGAIRTASCSGISSCALRVNLSCL
ncbi:hypothetical protein DFH09DRAFT_1174074 [Mycena vulgaris]|nr:hypothetical protein DFH09DRAFT_1174074 [Mycena vulgaris]